MGMMDRAKFVTTTTPAAPDTETGLVVEKKKISKLVLFSLLACLALVAGAVYGGYRCFSSGAGTETASASVEIRAEKPDAPTAEELPADCHGDISKTSDLHQWYCQTMMTWKIAVDDEIHRLNADVARLKERDYGGGTSLPVWILIGLIIANAAAIWIKISRRDKTI